MSYRKRSKVKPGLRFKVGDAWDGEGGEPFVAEGSIVEAIGLPGQTVFVRGRGYEVEWGMLAFRVVEGKLGERDELSGRAPVGFVFQQRVTKFDHQLEPLSDAARELRDLVIRQVRNG
jgi:hypothetical protein